MKQNVGPSIQTIRSQGARYFATHGLPTKKDEDWKYTSLKSLTEATLKEAVFDKDARLSMALKEELRLLCHPRFLNLVFIDGRLTFHPTLPEGMTISEISKASELGEFLRRMKKVRKQAVPVRQDSFEALNSAHFQCGVLISLPPRKKLSKPLQIVSVSTGKGTLSPKILISVGARSQLRVIETNVGGVSESLINSVTEILVEPRAQLSYLRFQNQALVSNAISRSRIYLKQGAHLESLSVQAGGQLSRHNLDVYCLGTGATAQINGLVLGSGKQHFDNHTHIDHVVGGCTTQQLYKSILDGQAHSVFDGRVLIRSQAQKASSDQLNNNLLLGSGAESDSKPQLDIFADDVKATHGSTVGQLDAEEIFYFLSRGISRETALEMLALGFAQDVIDRISDPVIQGWMRDHLKACYARMKGQAV